MSKISKILSACAAACCIASCSPIEDLCTKQHPHRGQVMLAWNWPKSSIVGSAENVSRERVTVLAVRTSNMIKYAGELNRPANGVYQKYICRTLPIPTYDENWAQKEVTNVMHEGEYDLLSFNAKAADFTVEYDKFLTSNINYFNNVEVKFNTYDKLGDHNSLAPYADFTDLNDYRDKNDPETGGGYLLPRATEMLYGIKTGVKVRNAQTTRVLFNTMNRVTQNVTFVFDVEKKDKDVAVNEMVGEIAGVPNRITLLKNEMPYTKTYRTHFKVNEKDMSRFDSFGNDKLHIETTVPLLGIVRSAGPDLHVGPGILQIRLKTWVKDENGDKVPGKTLRAGINLYNLLKANPSVVLLNSTKCRQATKDLRLVIKMPLQITKDEVVPNSNGMEGWINVEELPLEL